MSADGTDGSVPEIYRFANPLLYQLPQDDITIQPYWIMVLQILFEQFAERTWNFAKNGVFLTTLEIGFIRLVILVQLQLANEILNNQEYIRRTYPPVLYPAFWNFATSTLAKREKLQQIDDRFLRKLKFDIFNFLFQSLPLTAHAAWYCYIQSSCPSARDGTPWNCYNAFGYRLYNYIFVSYSYFVCVYFVKSLSHGIKALKRPKAFTLAWYSYQLGRWSFRVTFLFVGALILPFLYTNVIPMLCAYGFMTIIYVALWSAVLFSTVFLMLEIPFVRRLLPIPGVIIKEHRALAAAAIVFSIGIYTYPILLSTLYNYSQYLYYGENYITTMSNEYNSRDTGTYFDVISNSLNQKFHTILDSI